jgi:uroporphyrinogen decarboxylase
MISTGIDGISLDSMVDFAEIKKIVPEEIFLIGNLDPVNVIAYGDKTVVENNIKILLQVMNDRNNFVLSTGCDLPEDADLHNIQLMFNLARGENRKG